MSEPILQSTITCPRCGHAKQEQMPTDACQWFYECEGCHALLRPKEGDCCVFCSYGTNKCPPVQLGEASCCGTSSAAQSPHGGTDDQTSS
jgi:hypothetical protein